MLCVHEAIKGPAELVTIVKPNEILSPSLYYDAHGSKGYHCPLLY